MIWHSKLFGILTIGTKCRNSVSNADILTKWAAIRFQHYHSGLTARDILAESHGEHGTLATRFIKHIALERCKIETIVPKLIKYSQYYPLTHIRDFDKILRTTDKSQLPQVTVYTTTFRSNGHPANVASAISSIDNMCCEHLYDMNIDEILRNLYSFMYLIPNKILKLKFYESGMKKIVNDFDDSQAKEVFVQTCFYLGLSKNKISISKLMPTFLSDFSDIYINRLNTLDFAVVSNGAYKTSTAFGSEICKTRLVTELTSKNLDNDLLITFIKSARMNRIKSNEILDVLDGELKKISKSLDFKGLCHIMAFYAENGYNRESSFDSLVECAREFLETFSLEEIVFNDARPKDLARYFWSCAHLNFSKFNPKNFEYFEKVILRKIERNEFERYLDELTDICLSLWMLNYRSIKLISTLLNRISLDSQRSKQKPRIESRLKLLASLLQLEPLEGIDLPKFLISNPLDEHRIVPNYLKDSNDKLIHVLNLVTQKKDELNIRNIKLTLPILELNVAGLLIEDNQNREYFVEVIDKNGKLCFNNEPNAFVSLKIRTLQNLKKTVVTIDTDQASDDDIIDKVQEIVKCNHS